MTIVSLFAAAQWYRTVLYDDEVLPVREKLEGFAISYDPIAGALAKLCGVTGMEWVRI